jgi:hypothetical protein
LLTVPVSTTFHVLPKDSKSTIVLTPTIPELISTLTAGWAVSDPLLLPQTKKLSSAEKALELAVFVVSIVPKPIVISSDVLTVFDCF